MFTGCVERSDTQPVRFFKGRTLSLYMRPLTKRNTIMKKEIDTFIQPVGSVPFEESSLSSYEIRGKGGSLRHRMSISADNPYLAQLESANNNQDKDALYERAIDWEANRDQYEYELQKNREILEEQREYDDPLNQVARQRKAGINPDLAGSSGAGTGSGISATMAVPSQADVTAATSFSNKYDNIDKVFAGINTVVSAVGAITSSVGAVNGLFEAISTFGTRRNILESQASGAAAQAQLLGTQAALQDATFDSDVSSKRLANIERNIGLLGQISEFITPEVSNADAVAILDALGINSEEHESIMRGLELFRKTPAFQDSYNRQKLSLAQSKGMLPVFGVSDFWTQLSDFQGKLQLSQAENEFYISEFAKLVTTLTSTPENAQNIATAELTSNAANVEEMKIRKEQAISTVKAILKNITYRKSLYDDSLKRAAELDKEYKKAKGPSKEYIGTALVKEQMMQMQLMSLSNSELSQIYNLANDAGKRRFLYTTTSALGNGVPKPLFDIKRERFFSSYMFGDIPAAADDNTTSEITKKIIDIIF